ncbi:MAG: hypothetical protein DRG83_11710 [Deltaproteobacteria bacterium]|nr:MAG: hypothetical protein DRG83_11710 [Deltaproteobacteria bacterium]
MRREEYIKIQLQSSEWTRQNPNSMALVQDSIQEFCKYVPLNYYILEIGCGDGYSLDLLKAKGYRKLIGCDINLTKLKTASSFGHIVVVQDAHSLGFRSEVFDAVYCTAYIGTYV